jgi:WhiB family redox-sensing transcriptional regulator
MTERHTPPPVRTPGRHTPGTGITRPPEWTEHALCARVDAELFYPEKGGSPKAAKRVCDACEVKAECLADALQRGEIYGVRGGLTPHERRKMRRAA